MSERFTGILIGLFLATVCFLIGATSAKYTIPVDCYMDYDCYVDGNVQRNTNARTNVCWMALYQSDIPSACSSTAEPYTYAFSNSAASAAMYICVTNNWLGSGTNWAAVALTRNW